MNARGIPNGSHRDRTYLVKLRPHGPPFPQSVCGKSRANFLGSVVFHFLPKNIIASRRGRTVLGEEGPNPSPRRLGGPGIRAGGHLQKPNFLKKGIDD